MKKLCNALIIFVSLAVNSNNLFAQTSKPNSPIQNFTENVTKIVALGKKVSKDEMIMTFSIERGEKVFVTEINFIGNNNFTNEELVSNLKDKMEDSWQIFDRRKYEYYLQKYTLPLIRSKGLFKAKIDKITPKYSSDNEKVTISIEEGIRYRLGEIKVEGARALNVWTKIRRHY
jgi:outer membrane protein assembly factor BamA